MIEVKNLVKKYGNHTAVDHLSFTVEKGQVYGFLGPNGAGKSTTMNIMIGYLSATEGEVLINGHSIFEEPEEAKRYIGYLPELPPLYMDMTVLEYLNFVAELKKIPKQKRKANVTEVMQMTRVTEMQGRLLKHLSKGYKQRVGFAQALLGNPEIIILDEPTVGLDPKQVMEVRELIKRLSQNHTIILSSHILSEISAVCDQVLIMNKGKLVASGTPESLKELTQNMREVDLLIKGKKEEINGVLKKISKIKKYSTEPSEEKDVYKVLVRTEPKDDIREELFRAFTKTDMAIIGMQTYEKTLEDIFLDVTKNDKAYMKKQQRKQSEKPQTKEIEQEVEKESEQEIEQSNAESEEGVNESDL